MDYIDRGTLTRLNKRAARIQRKQAASGSEAVYQAAREAGLREVGWTGACVLFEDALGRRLNAWLYGPHSEDIADGGAGFDDQVDLHDEEPYATKS